MPEGGLMKSVGGGGGGVVEEGLVGEGNIIRE